MRKISLFLIAFLSIQLSFAQEFDVREFAADLADLSGIRSEKQTVNGEPYAIVKIVTNIRGMNFDANQGNPEVEHKNDGYWLYVAPRERNIKLMASGYMPLDVPMPEPAKSKSVYKMVVATKGGVLVSDLVKINFRLNQSGVHIQMGDGAPIMATTNTAVYEVSKGKHQFRFIKDGFKEQQIAVDAKEEKTMDITLEPGGLTQKMELSSIVMIESEPSGAEIFLNDQKVAITPHQAKLAPGKYTLRLQMNDYYAHNEQFTLEAGKTTAIPKVTMKPRFGFLQLTSTPSSAEVLLNGKAIGTSPVDRRRISSGNYEITVRKPLYHEHIERFTVNDSEDKTLNIKLKEAFGELSITSEPSGATVFIDEREVGKTPYLNPRQLSGTYNVRLSYDLHADTRETITVKDGAKTSKFMVLLKNYGTLQITANESDIYVNGKKVGTGNYRANLPAGSYKVKATRDKHKDDDKDVFMIVGQTENITLTPKPRMGGLSIISNPFETRGAEIYIDNKKQQQTTPAIFPILAGSYELTVKKNGYKDYTKRIIIRESNEESVEVIMEIPVKETSKTVYFSSTPDNAIVYIDGNYAGITPFSKTLNMGGHEIKMNTGHSSLEKTITVEMDGENDIHFDIAKQLREQSSEKSTIQRKTIWITSNVTGANVYIAGVLVGNTPFSYTLEKERAALYVTHKNYKDKIHWINQKESVAKITLESLQSKSNYNTTSNNRVTKQGRSRKVSSETKSYLQNRFILGVPAKIGYLVIKNDHYRGRISTGIGFQFGYTVLLNRLVFKSEINYAYKAIKFDDPAFNGYGQHYVEFMPFLQYYLFGSENKIFFEYGLNFGKSISSKEKRFAEPLKGWFISLGFGENHTVNTKFLFQKYKNSFLRDNEYEISMAITIYLKKR
ncbi:MAG: PEGA domain-containing protein [Candidatus Bipolaricaulis sp.]|nr:PEGA domain-containing protein [Candidatus Bipolaricaulis sp.]